MRQERLLPGVLELFSKRKRNEGKEGPEDVTGDKSEGTGVGPEACHATEWGEDTGWVGTWTEFQTDDQEPTEKVGKRHQRDMYREEGERYLRQCVCWRY